MCVFTRYYFVESRRIYYTDGTDVTGDPSQRIRSSMYSAPDGTRRTSSDETREKPMSGTRKKGAKGEYRTSTRGIATPANSQQIRSPDQLPSSPGTLCWPRTLANYGGQTQADDPAYSDRAVRGKRTTGTRMGLRAKTRVPRLTCDTIGRVPGPNPAPTSRLPANFARKMQLTTGRIES